MCLQDSGLGSRILELSVQHYNDRLHKCEHERMLHKHVPRLCMHTVAHMRPIDMALNEKPYLVLAQSVGVLQIGIRAWLQHSACLG